MRWILSAILILTWGTVGLAQTAPAAQPTTKPVPARVVTVQGTVFEDRNTNGTRDAGEPPLADMAVSEGVEIRRTGADGRFEFRVEERISGSVFVCTPSAWRASREFYVITDFERFDGKTQPADIGLVRDPQRDANRFVFVQLSDTHVTEDEERVRTMMDDLEVVNRLSDKPMFIAATGDLTNKGSRVVELQGYTRAIQVARMPYYNIVGNHDYGGEARPTENYERFLGPRYYSFGVGQYHFVARDSMAPDREKEAAKRQDRWMEQDVALNAKGKRIIVLQHFLPTNGEMDWWSRFKTAAIFSGHWHGQRERLYKEILDVNSAPLRFGGIDRCPRGFRIIHVDGDDLRCEWRVGQQDRRVEVVHPAARESVGGKTIDLRALAYDTAVKVQTVRYRVLDAAGAGEGKPLAEGEMRPEGAWSWTARWTMPASVPQGSKTVKIDVTGADGSRWNAQSTFELADASPSPPAMGQDWPFFHGDAGHRGFVAEGPRPPLSMAWATYVGGSIHLASPVIGHGRVYAGTGFRESLGDCQVVALNLTDGKMLWRAPVDSSIKHSLAVWKDSILAVSQAATLYCFDPDGKPRWDASLAREESHRWELSFPVTDGKAVYAGRCAGFGAYDLATGDVLWRQESGRDWWPSMYSGPSLGTGTVYQGGPFVRALNPATGDVIWKQEKTVVSTVAVVPAVVERGEESDRLYVFENDKTLMCLDGRSGDVNWKANCGDGGEIVPLGNETGTPAVGADVVCVGGGAVKWPGDSEPTAAMHGIDKETGRLLWRQPVGRGVVSSIPYQRDESTITSSPVIVGEVVYFGANDGYIYALDVKTGERIWQYRLGVPIASTLAVTGNAIIVAAWDGTVYAFTSKS